MGGGLSESNKIEEVFFAISFLPTYPSFGRGRKYIIDCMSSVSSSAPDGIRRYQRLAFTSCLLVGSYGRNPLPASEWHTRPGYFTYQFGQQFGSEGTILRRGGMVFVRVASHRIQC